MTSIVDLWLDVPAQRRKRIVLGIATLAFVGWVLWTARGALLPYFLGLALAYVLAPVVSLLEEGFTQLGGHRGLGLLRRGSRVLAILLTYLLLIALVVGFFALVVPLVMEQANALWAERERIWARLSIWAEDLLEMYELLPNEIRIEVEAALGRANEVLVNVARQAVEGTAVAISYTVSLVLAVFIVPFWTFYLLLDTRTISRSVVRMIPPGLRADAVKMATLINGTLSAYLRGQLFLAFLIGSISTVAFSLLGVRFSVLLGLIAGIFELIPNIGPLLGGIPAIIMALTQAPTLAVWTALFVFGVQQVENVFFTPRVLGQSVQLHPVVVMVVLVIGSEIAGLVGLFLAPVVTAVLRDLFRYLYYRFADVPLSPEEALKRSQRVKKNNSL
jgi:predicted PurR-regulated permease PerM